MSDRMKDLLRLDSETCTRYTIVKGVPRQSVASHSFRVAVIALELANLLNLCGASHKAAILEWALVHDGPEAATGDIQHPVKVWLEKQVGVPGIKGLFPLMEEMEKDLCPWIKEYWDQSTIIYDVVFVADRLEMADFLYPYITREDVKRMRDGLISDIHAVVERRGRDWGNAVGQILVDFADQRTPWQRMEDNKQRQFPTPSSSPETGSPA